MINISFSHFTNFGVTNWFLPPTHTQFCQHSPIQHHYSCKSASTWLVFITSQDMQLDDVWERNDLVTGLGIAVDWCYTDCRLILVLVHNSLGRISDQDMLAIAVSCQHINILARLDCHSCTLLSAYHWVTYLTICQQANYTTNIDTIKKCFQCNSITCMNNNTTRSKTQSQQEMDKEKITHLLAAK